MAVYSLLVSDIATRVRRTFGDESSVQITDADILRWVNDGAQYIIDRNQDSLVASETANVVAGQHTYTADQLLGAGSTAALEGENWHHYRSISYRRTSNEPYRRLTFLTNQEMDRLCVGWQDGPDSGDPRVYTIVQGVVNVYPTPDVSVTNGFQVFVNYRPEQVTATSNAAPFYGTLQYALIHYCLWQAYQLDEDWAAAQVMATQFENQLRLARFQNESHVQGQWDTYGSITTDYEDSW